MPSMLVLFDIDGTMLLSQRAGATAMIEAGRRLFGPRFSFDDIEIAGRLDPLIWADAAAAIGIDDPAARHDEFRALYIELLTRRFAEDATASALPGVHALIERLAALEDVTLGVLTGNYEETGRLKMEAAGYDVGVFSVAAWGSDGGHRRDLPPVAMDRYRAHMGRAIDPGQVLIIGDTPHDIDCAHANRCRALGVATGPSFSRAELEEHGAELVVDDLSDTETILRWMLEPMTIGR